MSLHLGMFKRMPNQLLKFSTISNCAIKAGRVDAISVASSVYHLLVKVRLFDLSFISFLCGFDPYDEWFYYEDKNEWRERERLSLKCTS